jgi:hypothetical protein
MLAHLYADVVEEEGSKGGGKKKGGSMQTISATHRVNFHFNNFSIRNESFLFFSRNN